MDQKDKISVITVVYNDAKNVERTLVNIFEQTYPFVEIVVVDGGSTDGTLDVLKKYDNRIIWISEKDNGIYDAMNKGAKMASGKWLIYRNVGDLFASDRAIEHIFEKQVDDDVCILHGDCRFICEMGEKVYIPAIINSNYDFTCMPIFHPSAFIKTSYQCKNPYDISYKSSADFEFFLKAIFNGVKIEYRPITIADYHYGDGISVKNWYLVLKENKRVLEEFGKKTNMFEYWLGIINMYLHNTVKIMLPQRLVKILQKRNLKAEGWTIH